MAKHSETNTTDIRTVANSQQPASALAKWIDLTIRPDAFGTFVVPIRRNARDPHFYLSLWTRKAEAALFGKTSLHIPRYDGRCLWLMVNETSRERWSRSGETLKLNHFHGLLRFPTVPTAIGCSHRLMTEERRAARVLTIEERCARMETELVEASQTTPEALDAKACMFRQGADIQIKPYHATHATYIFKQLGPAFREHWTERPDETLLRDHGLFILPHLPKFTKGNKR